MGSTVIVSGGWMGTANDGQNLMHPIVGWSAWSVLVLFALVAVWSWTYAGPDQPAPRDGYTFVRHFIHYGLFKGYAGGSPQHPFARRIPVEPLEPGDIIVCGNPGAVYGTWSHATIYLGEGRVLAQDLLSGIGMERVGSLEWYDHLRVLRPRVSSSLRTAAARTAMGFAGQVFNLMAHPRDPWQLNCSRCVEEAYRLHGIELSDGRFWTTPDALVDSAGTCLWKH
jgi:cell wall-associated NlpC family hydrolase